jgi:ABC-type multidrug transport system ATPase subunit
MTPGDGTIVTRGLVKRLGRRDALRGIDLDIERGQIVALIGPNGAGKTTLLRVLSTLMRPDAGVVTVNGYRLPAQAGNARSRVGAAFHHPMMYGDLNARENLLFHARMHRVDNPGSLVDRILDEFGLDPGHAEPVRTYSRGMLQRLALAKALLPQPDVLLLDEPFTGLDVQSVAKLNTLLQKIVEGGCTVLLSGHDLAGIEQLAVRYILMSEGRVISTVDRDGLPEGGLNSLYRGVISGSNGGGDE